MTSRLVFGSAFAALGVLAVLAGVAARSAGDAERDVEGLLQALAEDGRLVVAARLAADIPLDSAAAAWRRAQPTAVAVYPQVSTAPMARRAPVSRVFLRALYNDRDLGFLLEWDDPSPDLRESAAHAFRDAVALQFPVLYGEGVPLPYIGMGQRGLPVNIWHWKASWQADVERGFADVEDAHPGMAVDFYPFAQPGATPIPPTLSHDRTFLTGWGAGNPLSDPRRRSPVENLLAEGFGTLTAAGYGGLQGRGVWQGGHWQVVVKRALRTEAGDGVQFAPEGGLVPVAIAVWQGGIGQVDGQKALSGWHFVRFAGMTPSSAYLRQLVWAPARRGEAQRGEALLHALECHSCHVWPGAPQAGDIGPELTYAGGIHPPQYLLEAVRTPNAHVVPSEHYMDRDGRSKMPEYDPETLAAVPGVADPEQAYYDMVEFLRTLK
jgi:hypothetical protein